MNKALTIILRAGISAAFLVSLFGQILVIPNSGVDELRQYFPHGPMLVVYAALAILGVACAQVAMAAVWMLLAMIERDALFSPKAFRWIDVIIGASAAATLLSLGVVVHLLMFTSMPNMLFFGAWLFAIACAAVGASFAMLMVVVRGLLRKATDLQTEMAEVV